MKGTIIGDVVGSRYEFDRSPKTKTFFLFDGACEFTDDTVMTMAVAETIMTVGRDAEEEEFKAILINSFKSWGHAYPLAGYGLRFNQWLSDPYAEPYGSFGNGSAMRVAPVGWAYDSLEKTLEVAKWTAEVTHNHPEGIKGAQCVAGIIYLMRKGCDDKDWLKTWITSRFGYDLSRTCDDIRPTYHHVESCQETVPEAITAFLEGSTFEDVIRNAVSLGGDCDTLTAIATSMAEAEFGADDTIWEECERYLDGNVLEVVKGFYRFIG